MTTMTIQQTLELALQRYGNGRLRETEALCRQILDVEPQHADALHLLGVLAHQAGRNADAVALLRGAIASKPLSAEYHSNLGVVLTALGHVDEATAACRQALALNPDFAEAHYNFGNALRDAGRLDQAAAAYRQALTIKLNYPQAHNNLGNVLRETGEFDQAEGAYRDALFFKPDYAHARSNLANVLKDMGRLDEAIDAHRLALENAPTSAEIHSNLILTLYYAPDADAGAILSECRRWNTRHAEPLRGRIRAHSNDRSQTRPLRVGFVSPDLRMHSVAYFLLPLLEASDKKTFHATCYATTNTTDAVMDRLRVASDAWCSLVGLSDDAAAQRIRDDRIDVLVDLSGHGANNRLLMFARKPAPVQAAYLGFIGTTGLATIDYRLTDSLVDPSGTESFCTERLVRLPETAWCFAPLSGSPSVAQLPAVTRGYVTFGSFNSLAKVTPDVLDCWARILEQVPGSRLRLKGVALRAAEVVARTRRFFIERSIGPERLELLIDDHSQLQHLSQYDHVDIALDTFPYPGMATTCEALWMGIPVITLAGSHHRSRVGASLLTNAGLPELVAPTPDAYVQFAATLGADLSRLANLRTTMRERMQQSALMDAKSFAHAFESSLSDVWRNWCEQHPAR
jgi:protein O-GlcNAc transferase